MVGIWDCADLGPGQSVEFYETGRVRIVQVGDKPQEIWLDAAAAKRLFDALQQYEDDITLEAKAAERRDFESKGWPE